MLHLRFAQSFMVMAGIKILGHKRTDQFHKNVGMLWSVTEH